MVKGFGKALLTSATSVINEGKGKVFVKAVYFSGVSQQVILVNVQNGSRMQVFRATKILSSIYHPQ